MCAGIAYILPLYADLSSSRVHQVPQILLNQRYENAIYRNSFLYWHLKVAQGILFKFYECTCHCAALFFLAGTCRCSYNVSPFRRRDTKQKCAWGERQILRPAAGGVRGIIFGVSWRLPKPLETTLCTLIYTRISGGGENFLTPLPPHRFHRRR